MTPTIDETARERALSALVALGPVLALTRADRVECCCRRFADACALGAIGFEARLDDDGPYEALVARDRYGEACAKVVRLPDSHYYGWERASACFAADRAPRRIDWPRAATERRVAPRWRGALVELVRCQPLGLAARPLDRTSTATTCTVLALAHRATLALDAAR